VQLVNLRLVIAGATTPPDFPREPPVTGAPVGEREVEVWQDGALRSVPLYLRNNLHHGHRLSGPAIVAQEDTTVCIPAGFEGAVDALGNLHLTGVAA
jgi:N-methylhydantoinase A